jgi:hypothetical protein
MNVVHKLVCLSLLMLFTINTPAHAERIITISDVANRVKVRHRPDLDSPAIGSLNYNESAELLESLPYWYHIKLDNGVPGYISRAWTRRLSEAEGDGEVVRIGYWKIGAPAQGALNFKAIVQAIESNFDLLAVSGLAQGTQPGYDALLKALGPGWAALTAEQLLPSTGGAPCAILYRRAIIRPCSGSKSLTYYSGSGGNEIDSASLAVAFGCFEAPVNKSSMGLDFMIGVYSVPEAAENGDIEKMGQQLDAVFAAAQAARPSERDIIVAGTFNLSTAGLQDIVDARVKTKGTGSVLGPDGEPTSNLYDHMLIKDESTTIEALDPPQVLDVRNVAASKNEFYGTCSDHLPVLLRLRTTGPDDD